MCATRKDSELDWLAKNYPETNPITIKPKTASHAAEQFSWIPLPTALHLGALPNKSLALSACLSSDNSFLSVRREPSFGPWKGFPFLKQMATTKGHLLHWYWHLDHSGYSGASLPANGPDPGAATGTLFPGLLLMQTTGQSAPTGKEQETLLTSLLFPLSFFSLALPIVPVFLIPIPWSWTQEFGQRASAWAEDWRLITASWERTWFPLGPSSSPPFSGSPGESPVMPGYLQVAGDVCKSTPFAPLSRLLLLFLSSS